MAKHHHQILIIGGGMVGMTMAKAATDLGLTTAMLEPSPASITLAPEHDGRASAIAFATSRMLDALGVWRHVAHEASPIEDIMITDGKRRGMTSSMHIHFDHRDIGDTPLGHIVENRHMRMALQKALEDAGHLHVQDQLADLDLSGPEAKVTTKNGDLHLADLVIAADGHASPSRGQAGIVMDGHDYDQHALVFTVHLEHGHDQVAHEHFLEQGPLAVLPMTNSRANIVWTLNEQHARDLEELGHDFVSQELQEALGHTFGNITIETKIWRYPLRLRMARQYGKGNLLMIGDAAHAIHPIAGQGFNLGLRDVATLAELLQRQIKAGQQVAGRALLDDYDHWRRQDCMVLGAVTHGVNGLFSNDVAPVRMARDLGLGLVNRVKPLKQLFMRHAGGDMGDLPPLMRGQWIMPTQLTD